MKRAAELSSSRRRGWLIPCLLLAACQLPATDVVSRFPPWWEYGGAAPVTSAAHGMVVAAEPHASRVGRDVLAAGGNAVDAAVATSLALAVTYPQAGNIGGGGFLLARFADGRAAAVDYREQAPAAATRDMYLAADGALTDRSLYGALAAGVPGTVAGLWAAHQRFGSQPWEDLVAPAIELAEHGFEPGRELRQGVRKVLERIAGFDAERRRACAQTVSTFAPALQPGPFRQPELAATLRRIAASGPAGFYDGPVAEALARSMRTAGGLITTEDLERYAAEWREPLRWHYRDHTVLGMPPSSSGGAVMTLMANMLQRYALPDMAWDDPGRIHLSIEAMKRAYADRNAYLGDPAFVDMPLERLLSTAYADERAAGIDRRRATPSTEVAPGLGPAFGRGEQTTHFSIADGSGNAVSVTTTLNTSFGSLVSVEGFLLNNEMDDFAARPGFPNAYGLVQGEANAIEPGKRMLSSMSPSIVLDPDGELLLVTGTPGGSRIISVVFQSIVNALDHGMGVGQLVAAPRVHHQHLPDVLYYEAGGLTAEVVSDLRRRGHDVRAREHFCDVQAIVVLPDGSLTGAADPRGGGLAAGY